VGGETGPVRSHAQRFHAPPYARSANAQVTRGEEGALLKAVKGVVNWLMPTWFSKSSPKEEQVDEMTPFDFGNDELRHNSMTSMDTDMMETSRMEEMSEMELEQQMSKDAASILKRLTTERESKLRKATFRDLANFFRAKGEVLLTVDEYEQVANIIQRQQNKASRRIYETPSMTIQTPRRSPRRTPAHSASKVSIDAPMTVEREIEAEEEEPAIKLNLPIRKSRVFSARYDDMPVDVRPISIANVNPAANRLRMIEETRRRVADQTRIAQQQSTEVVKEKIVQAAIVEPAIVEKPSFSFTIPIPTPISAPLTVPKFAEEIKPKLVFDFGNVTEEAPKRSTEIGLFDFSKPAEEKRPAFTFSPPKVEEEKKSAFNFQLPKADINPEEEKKRPAFNFSMPATEESKPEQSGKPTFSFEITTKTEESKPMAFSFGALKSPESELKPLTSGSFPFSAPKQEESELRPLTSGSLSFGAPKQEESKPAAFTFGATKSEESKPLSFAFGAPKQEESKPTAFSFGVSKLTESKPETTKPAALSFGASKVEESKPTLGFGASATALAASPFPLGGVPVTETKPAFSFGMTMEKPTEQSPFTLGSKMEESKPAAPFNFGFGQPESKPAAFGFGASKPEEKSPFSFGTAPQNKNSSFEGMNEAPTKRSAFSFDANAGRLANETAPAMFDSMATPSKPEPPKFGFGFGAAPVFNAPPSSTGPAGFGASDTGMNFGQQQPTATNLSPAPMDFNFGGTAQGNTQFTFNAPTSGTGGFSAGAAAPRDSGRVKSLPITRRRK
jgi:hypothetical protein